MNVRRHRPLTLQGLRAFEAVARLLNFRQAGEEMHLTQSAVSRQIRALEDELGTAVFQRGTRHVALTHAGQQLLRAVAPQLAQLDATVRQIRSSGARARVSVTTFASFASLWLIPRLEHFQREHPGLDIRLSASDTLLDLEDPELDLAIRHVAPAKVPEGAERLFAEVLSPIVSPWLADRCARGELPPLRSAADLLAHTLLENDERESSERHPLSWRHWLKRQGVPPQAEPHRWIYLNYTHQQVQAAQAGQGIALGRLPLVAEAVQRGELVEPLGVAGRLPAPQAYWLLPTPGGAARPEVAQLCAWIRLQAAATRALTDDPGH